MTENTFRDLALSLPEAQESQHMNHPDFRVRGKIFATLRGDGEMGVVMLTPEQQGIFTQAEPEAFRPVKGAWGRRGATECLLGSAAEEVVRQALISAWRNKAPQKLSRGFEG